MVVIDVQNLQERLPAEDLPLGEWASQVIGLLGIEEAELSVVVVDDEEITELNRSYLGHEGPTNVISFPQQEGDGPVGDHLGDVVISIERAAQEAAEAGMDLDERMLQLLIHGICHLVGFDHERGTEEDAARMEEVEEGLFLTVMGQPAQA
ncbi:MAG TPA: rRNA maturation RNase YbeY [Deltaproteobacteria bacterium]|jgi:probable rRNA maturation factor|nr:rRNA maturation RNase YbeY [Deltaproteobacteria bacterium]HOI07239.1 rRNA maturation RNase YbeY [Deltaproteobacteria bacterium]